ncbi:hypothetical protein ACQPUY_08695 [Clostridium nigeriense]|uniref:hypothetical protein n=1 Tax=Clostridium nigeriense TaxID=1805470 RepID=UPI003D32D5EC
MKNNEKLLLGVSCFLGGVVAGFLIAPIKKGMYFGNNCGNHVSNAEDLKKIAENNLYEDISEINH